VARDGIGRLTLIDGAYRTVWREGREIERQVISHSAPVRSAEAPKLAVISETVKLKLSLDHERAIAFENSDPDAESHTYEAEHSPGSMKILLGSKGIRTTWKGGGMLVSDPWAVC